MPFLKCAAKSLPIQKNNSRFDIYYWKNQKISYFFIKKIRGWSLKSGAASKSGNKAIGKGTFVKKTLGITVDTRDITCTLTCDVNGNLS